MKIIKHRPGVYYARFKTDRGPQQVRFEATSMAEAESLVREAKLYELERAAQVRALTAETVSRLTVGSRVTCADALDMWRHWAELNGLVPNTRARYDTYISAFIRQFKLAKRPPAAIRDTDLSEFVNPPNGKIKASTRTNRKNALQSWFLVLVSRGLVVGNPMAGIRVHMHKLSHQQLEKKVREPFTPVELGKLSQIRDPFWRVAIPISLHTGLRLGDIAQLDWASFQKQGKMIIWTDKSNVRIEMPLHPEVERAIASVPKTDDRFVFPDQRELMLNPKLRSKLSTYFARELERVGVHGKSFHCLRHTFATQMSRTPGETIDTIRCRLGHALPQTTENYIHAGD